MRKWFTYNVGSMPNVGNMGNPEVAEKFAAVNTPKPAVRGGGEVRPGERSWVVYIAQAIARAVGISEPDESYGTKYRHYAGRALRGLWHWRRINRRIADGHLPNLGYAKWAEEDYENFKASEKSKPTGARFMRGIATAWAIKLFSGVILFNQKKFEEKIVQDAKEILALRKPGDPEIVLQFELPLEMALGALLPMPNWLRQKFYGLFLRSIERIILQLPEGTAFAFHLCWGDLGGRALVPRWLQAVGAKIAMVNAITALPLWENYRLFAIHDPFGDGRHAPRVTWWTRWRYARRLNPLPEGVLYAFGIVHRNLRASKIAQIANALADVLEKKGAAAFALSTPCGMGRMITGRARELLESIREAFSSLR
ncbi:MAG TPA: hypothetical protein VK497_05060 [Candidatus Saccharimonadales bacterium]|nr:hypothetical protein [Candidatus Saccharimonadales bacterium]